MDSDIEKYHDAEIRGIKINRDKDSLDLYVTLANKNNIVISFVKPVLCDFSFFRLQNVIYEISIYKNNTIPDFLLNEYSELADISNGFYVNHKIAYINPSVGLEGIIVFEALTVKSL